jgi:hypothetical protein
MVQAIRRHDGLRGGRADKDVLASRPSGKGPAFVLIERLERGRITAAEEVVRVLTGQAPKNPVNPEALQSKQAAKS